MTALTKYQRLEASALWRDAPGARAREVVVGLREATIVLSDPRSEMPLTQWSLPAIVRLNPGQMPARFAPDMDAGEELELDDAEMIAALNTVHRAIEARMPRPGRLRGQILGATVLAVLGVLIFWLPGQVKSYTAKVLPAISRADLGELALTDIARLTGQPCKAVPGRRAAAALAKRLFPQKPPRIEVLRDGLLTPAHLPGNILLLPAQLLETADGPDIIAGHLLIEALRASAGDPVDAVLTHIGLANTLGLLTTGKVPSDALKGFGETFLAPSPDPLMPPMPLLDQQLAAFEGAQVSSAAYGAAVGAANPSGQALVRQDPFALGAPAAVMSDENWLEFQAICSS